MEMFTSFQKVMADPDITTAGKSVFLNLLSRMDKKGYCYPAVNTMEKKSDFVNVPFKDKQMHQRKKDTL